MNEKIRVLIVDDHPLMRQALIRTLHGQPDIEVVGEGCDGNEAIEKAISLKPDVIIMDLGLPGKNGLQAIEEIVKENPSAHILVFSGMDDPTTILNAVQAGAIGFLEKANQEVDLVKAVRETHKGNSTLRGDIIHSLLSRSKTDQENTFFRDLLTIRELEIAEMIGNGYAYQAIAETLFLSDATVRSHVNHILSKLNLKSQAQLIRFVMVGGLEDPIVK